MKFPENRISRMLAGLGCGLLEAASGSCFSGPFRRSSCLLLPLEVADCIEGVPTLPLSASGCLWRTLSPSA